MKIRIIENVPREDMENVTLIEIYILNKRALLAEVLSMDKETITSFYESEIVEYNE